MTISINLIKKLRSITSLGIMECKNALIKSKGNINLAVDNLYNLGTIKNRNKKYLNSKSNFGYLNIKVDENMQSGIMIEFCSQTDFVTKNKIFLEFVSDVSSIALNNSIKNIKSLLQEKIKDKTIEQVQSILSEQFKENIYIKRLEYIYTKEGIIGYYLHRNKISSMVVLNKKIKELSHDLAMHITAMNPEYIKIENIEQDRIKKEKEIFKSQIISKMKNKPEYIIEKIINGKLNKLFQEITLYNQFFVKDNKKTISELLLENNCEVKYISRFSTTE